MSPPEVYIVWIQQVFHLALSTSAAQLQAESRLFFKPIQFHVELPDFGV